MNYCCCPPALNGPKNTYTGLDLRWPVAAPDAGDRRVKSAHLAGPHPQPLLARNTSTQCRYWRKFPDAHGPRNRFAHANGEPHAPRLKLGKKASHGGGVLAWAVGSVGLPSLFTPWRCKEPDPREDDVGVLTKLGCRPAQAAGGVVVGRPR